MFGIRKGKRHDTGQDVNINILVTPFLDMSFQLMAFFIMTYRPTPQEGQMALQLAAEKVDGGGIPDKPPEPDEKPKVDISVMITSNSGGIERLQVRKANQTVDVKGGLDGLRDYLAGMKKEDAEIKDQKDITIEASSQLEYANLVGIMDVCLKTDFSKPSFGTPPDLAPKTDDKPPPKK